MNVEIVNGVGNQDRAKVNSDNRLLVDSVSLSDIADKAINKEVSYILASGFISLTTTGSFNGLMYLKGLDSSNNFHIERIRICSNASGSLQIKMLHTCTTGTLISDANAGTISNTVIGSSNTLTNILTVYVASADGKTVTDGTLFTQYQQNLLGHSSQEYEGSIIIKKDQTLAIVAKPSASCDICIEVLGYVKINNK